ncbi:MAG TPA: hypothetical protein DCP30_01455, partial [Alistipes sp.]|nr:hypothetical protein [Alistipes sp.]
PSDYIKYSKKGCTAAIEGHFSTKKTTSGNGLRPPGGRAGKNGRGKRENERQSDRKGRPGKGKAATGRCPGYNSPTAGAWRRW